MSRSFIDQSEGSEQLNTRSTMMNDRKKA